MTILCYHSVDPDWSSGLSVSPTTFSRHCEWLGRNRHVVDLTQAVTSLDSSCRLPRGTLALTFDDGFASLHEHAFPALVRHRLPATVFLVAETLTPRGRAVDWVDDPPPYELKTLTLDQIHEMREAGVRFGSHSYSHSTLVDLTEEQCEHDLRASREVLEGVLNEPIRLLAYPRGRHDAIVRRAAQRTGFSHALSLPESRESIGRYAIPRVGVFRGNGDVALSVKCSRGYVALRSSRVFPIVRRIANGVVKLRGR